MNRRHFLRSTAGAAAALAATGRAAAQPPLNFVFILADDLGWSDVGCYGADLHATPNIDRLAREGMRFTDAYSAAPVCSPTRAVLLTGKHPARLHMTTWYENSANPTTRERLIPPVTVGDRLGRLLPGNPGLRHQHRRHLLGRSTDLLLPLLRLPEFRRGDSLHPAPGIRRAGRVPHRPADHRGAAHRRPRQGPPLLPLPGAP